jgi:beta-glucanase (GH16 family)
VLRRIRPALLVPPLLLAGIFLGAGMLRNDAAPSATRSSETASAETAGEEDVRGTPSFADDFDGNQLDPSRWNRCHWWGADGCTIAGNHELQWYDAEGVSTAGGALRLTAARQRVRGSDGRQYAYRSGMVTTGRSSSDRRSKPKFAFTYGYLEARVRVPKGAGLWPALWLLPATNRSLPEIDVFEIRGSATDRLSMHLHTASDGKGVSIGEHWAGADLSTSWHTFALDWRPGSLRWLIDGVEAWEVTGPKVPSEPMYLVANLAVGGDWPGPPNAQTPFPATFEIDSIRVWASSS